MKISIIGTGYVGLVSGTCFAETGITTTCVDIDKDKIERLKEGVIPIYEPGLEFLVRQNFSAERLRFSSEIKESLVNSDAAFIAVGTPPDEDGSADLSYVLNVARTIGETMQDYLVVVTKSTVPIGTSHKVKEEITAALKKRGVSIPFDVASNPEFLREGEAIKDTLDPDRIVVGTESERARKVLERLYYPYIVRNVPVLFMDIASAEITKYTANAMLATKISFMNDIANFCESVNANVDMVRRGIGADTRIGKKFIYPGVGYGGSCFPKDVKALIKTGEESGQEFRLLRAVEEVNNDQKKILFKKINIHFKGDLKGKKIALWGLAFKPKTDDMREAPALVLIQQLLDAGVEVAAFDPVAMDEAKRILGDSISFADNQYDVLENADALAVVTEWAEFKVPKFTFVTERLKNKVIFDGRNIYNPEQMAEFGYTYYGIGR